MSCMHIGISIYTNTHIYCLVAVLNIQSLQYFKLVASYARKTSSKVVTMMHVKKYRVKSLDMVLWMLLFLWMNKVSCLNGRCGFVGWMCVLSSETSFAIPSVQDPSPIHTSLSWCSSSTRTPSATRVRGHAVTWTQELVNVSLHVAHSSVCVWEKEVTPRQKLLTDPVTGNLWIPMQLWLTPLNKITYYSTSPL